jgi:catechol 2,3-dioxygenase-like lactoylglutathione lyase family enzyme
MRWTHFTLPVSDLAGSIRFFTEVCGLSVVRHRRSEGGSTVWVGPCPANFAMVREPSGHLVEFTHGQPLEGLRDAS